MDLEHKLEEIQSAAIKNGSPQQRNGFQIGDAVRLPNIDATFEVIGLKDESLVDLRAPSGRIVRAGWRTISKLPNQRRRSNQ